MPCRMMELKSTGTSAGTIVSPASKDWTRETEPTRLEAVPGGIFFIELASHVCFWLLADIAYVAFDIAFGGKADMVYCSANVRF
jgi:hypothetical protein